MHLVVIKFNRHLRTKIYRKIRDLAGLGYITAQGQLVDKADPRVIAS